MKEYRNEFCLKCFKENPQDREICDCGSRRFAFGDNINVINKSIVCDCGNNEFTFVTHVNMSPVHNTTYKCECGSVVGVQNYVEE
jgi:hypothetical protein